MLHTLLSRAGVAFACLSLSVTGFAKTTAVSSTTTNPTALATSAPLAINSASVDSLTVKLAAAAPDANPDVIRLALGAVACASNSGHETSEKLTVIDYSLPSSQPRLWVFDLKTQTLLFEELVAHGKNTGEKFAENFSNTYGSLQTSLGLFLTKSTYQGSNGYSLRMEGLDQGFNDKAMERAIVFHGAPYVSNEWVKKHGRIGRSWGCPAVSNGVAKKVIDTIKGEQFLFSYYPDSKWLNSSKFLNCSQEQKAVSTLLASADLPSATQTF